MPFLTLNGLTVNVLKGGQSSLQEIGGRSRSADGGLFINRTARKRKWVFKSYPLSANEAEALIGWIECRGLRWQWGITDSADEPIVSNSNATPYTYPDNGYRMNVRNTAIIESNTAADGDPVKLLSTAPSTFIDIAKWDCAMFTSDAATNICTAGERDAEGTPASDYTVVGTATISTDTNNYWQGTQSAKTSATVLGSGLRTSLRGGSTSTNYSGVVYLKGVAGGESVQVNLIDNGGSGAINGSVAVTLSADHWTAVRPKATSGTGTVNMYLRVVTTASGTIEWYSDGFSIVQSDYHVPWADDTVTAYTDRYIPDATFDFNKANFSMSVWSSGVDRDNGRLVMTQHADGTQYVDLIKNPGGTVRMNLKRDNGDITAITSTSTLEAFQDAWVHIAGTYDRDATTMRLYIDGTQEASNTSATFAEDDWAPFAVYTSASTGGKVYGYATDHAIYNYTLTPEMVAALAARTYVTPPWPQIEMDGDVINNIPVNVVGRHVKSEFVGLDLGDGDGFQSQNQIVTFELEEV